MPDSLTVVGTLRGVVETLHAATPGVTFEAGQPVLTIDRGSRLHRLRLSAWLAELFRVNGEMDNAIRVAAVKPSDVIASDFPVVDGTPAALIARLTQGDDGRE